MTIALDAALRSLLPRVYTYTTRYTLHTCANDDGLSVRRSGEHARTHARTHAFHRLHGAARRRKGTLGCAPERSRPKKRDDWPRATEKDARSPACLFVSVFSLEIAGMVTARDETARIVAKETMWAFFTTAPLFPLFFRIDLFFYCF